ncbi:NADH-quinone oxidoreductase subunit J [Sphingomonas corticis]|jgi:NADH-quinone oxidoreductase subunit J|uniref:NADH-quinone oxidoreductase subunit J n=1 Tax=Sphingomonas corticis TaxID=2722791 RepID=A0ABX1CKJ9_9SPHN|nr:NADH-quinone oxidoreductase subunit J [Sphingomonas corticis]NJR77438.1 NADH-quinone oxidoreductase subunit J [Sphingomonas corticis]
MIQAIAFYIFALVVLLSGAMTIASRNPVHSVLWLILAFFNAAGLMVLVGAEFIAMLLVIVYVGAVAVLFLFVVMMLDIDFASLRAGFVRYFGIGLVLAVALVAEILIGVFAWDAGGIELSRRAAPVDAGVPNITAVGYLLYTRYLFIFEAAGFVLLVAMIGAIVLTHRERSGSRYQNIARQVARRPQDATRNVRPEIGQGVQL